MCDTDAGESYINDDAELSDTTLLALRYDGHAEHCKYLQVCSISI